MTPQSVYYELTAAINSTRQSALDAGFTAYPNRVKGKPPRPPELPAALWINPATKESHPTANAEACAVK